MPNRQKRARPALLRRFASTTGAVDLASVLVGVLILGIVSGIVLAATQYAVPWAQDQGAKQSLQNIRISEASAYVGGNQYLSEKDLISGKYYDGKALADIDAAGDCYIAGVLSQTGNVYWTQNGGDTITAYKPGDTSACSDVKNLHDRLLGILPVNDLTLSYASTAFDPTKTNQSLSASSSGSQGPFTYTLTSGSLAGTGVALNPTTGDFTGPASWKLNFDTVATSYYTDCGIASGTLWCWGRNDMGQIGDGTVTPQTATPARVVGLNSNQVTAVSVGDKHACAIADAQLYCWGDGANGDLGAGNSAQSKTPQLVTAFSGKTVTAVSAGQSFTCAIADGALYCWGINTNGQVGRGDTTSPALSPVRITSGAFATGTVSAIATGQTHACAVVSGAAYCWGLNSSGQVGNATAVGPVTAPAAVDVSGVLAGKVVTTIDAGEAHTCAVASGAGYCWGVNSYGQLGNNSTSQATSPVAVVQNTALGSGVTSISAGRYYSCAVGSGKAACWGYGGYGDLGNNGTSNSSVPVSTDVTGVLAGKTVTSISASDRSTCAAADGALTCWGGNAYQQIPDATLTTAAQQNVPWTAMANTGANNGLPLSLTVHMARNSDASAWKETTLQLRVAVK